MQIPDVVQRRLRRRRSGPGPLPQTIRASRKLQYLTDGAGCMMTPLARDGRRSSLELKPFAEPDGTGECDLDPRRSQIAASLRLLDKAENRGDHLLLDASYAWSGATSRCHAFAASLFAFLSFAMGCDVVPFAVSIALSG